MATVFLRETAFGQIVRYASRNRLLKYPEELPDFVVPYCYCDGSARTAPKVTRSSSQTSTPPETIPKEPEEVEEQTAEPDLEKQDSALEDDDRSVQSAIRLARTKTREDTVPYSEARFEVDRAASLARTKSVPIQPTITSTGDILVDWYTTDDPANPQNWSHGAKYLSSFIIW